MQTTEQQEKIVIKRNGESETMTASKIRARLENLTYGLSIKHIDIELIISKVLSYASNGMTYLDPKLKILIINL